MITRKDAQTAPCPYMPPIHCAGVDCPKWRRDSHCSQGDRLYMRIQNIKDSLPWWKRMTCAKIQAQVIDECKRKHSVQGCSECLEQYGQCGGR